MQQIADPDSGSGWGQCPNTPRWIFSVITSPGGPKAGHFFLSVCQNRQHLSTVGILCLFRAQGLLPDQFHLPERLQHYPERQSGRVSQVTLTEMCLFKKTCDTNDWPTGLGCKSAHGGNELKVLLDITGKSENNTAKG